MSIVLYCIIVLLQIVSWSMLNCNFILILSWITCPQLYNFHTTINVHYYYYYYYLPLSTQV